MKKFNIKDILRSYSEIKKTEIELFSEYEDFDFRLLGKFLDGVATPEEMEQIAVLKEKYKDFPELFDSVEEFKIVKPETENSWILFKKWCKNKIIKFNKVMRNIIERFDGIGSMTPVLAFRGDVSGLSSDDLKNCISVQINSDNSNNQVVKVYDKTCALIIAIDDYRFEETGCAPLKTAVENSNKLLEILPEFQFTDMRVLMNKAATKKNILENMRAQMALAGNNGAMYIHFSGRSYKHPQKQNKTYLIPCDGSANKTDEIAMLNISLDLIIELSKQLEVKHLFVVLDCCYPAQTSVCEVSQVSDFEKITTLNQIISTPAIKILTASVLPEEYAEGLFAKAYADAFTRMKQNSFITSQNIVADIMRGNFENNQKPIYTSLGTGTGDFVFVKQQDN